MLIRSQFHIKNFLQTTVNCISNKWKSKLRAHWRIFPIERTNIGNRNNPHGENFTLVRNTFETKVTPLTVSPLCFLTLPCYRCVTTRSSWVKSADFMSTFDFDFGSCRQWTRPSIKMKYFSVRSGAWNIRLRSWFLMWFCDNLFKLWVHLYVIRNIFWIGIFCKLSASEDAPKKDICHKSTLDEYLQHLNCIDKKPLLHKN